LKDPNNTAVKKKEACVVAATCDIDRTADLQSDKPLTLHATIELKTLKLPS